MHVAFTDIVREVWPLALRYFRHNADNGKASALKLPASLTSPDVSSVLFFDTPDLHDSLGVNFVRKHSDDQLFGHVMLAKDLAADPDSERTRKILLYELISCIDAISHHERGGNYLKIGDPIIRPESSVELLTEFSDLWKRPVNNDLATAISSDIRLVDASILKVLKDDPRMVYALSDREFEELIAETLRSKGFEIELTGISRDGGKDIIAYRRDDFGNQKLVLECKRYTPPNHVGIAIVQRLHGVQDSLRATRGIVATSSFFTDPARSFAEQNDNRLTLWDYWDIQKLVSETEG